MFDASLRLTPSGLKRNIAPGDIVVIPNKQRATRSGVILASTRRAETIFSPSFVVSRLFNGLNRASSAALDEKMAFGSDNFICTNKP